MQERERDLEPMRTDRFTLIFNFFNEISKILLNDEEEIDKKFFAVFQILYIHGECEHTLDHVVNNYLILAFEDIFLQERQNLIEFNLLIIDDFGAAQYRVEGIRGYFLEYRVLEIFQNEFYR